MDHDIATAWYVAALSRKDTLPTLDSLLSRRTVTRRQTRQDALAVLQMLSSRYRIPLKVVH